MPELPEVEMARQVLEQAVGREVVEVDDRDTWVCRPHEPGEIARALEGGRLTAAHRRGKTMWCDTDTGHTLDVHLGMGGRLSVTDERPDRPEWDRFTLTFADGGRLRLVDRCRLGRVRLDADLSALGPDAEEITPAEFRTRVARGRSAVKARLLDQSVLAGVGNLLADETLWRARIHPAVPADELARKDLDRLYRNLGKTLADAIAHGGVHTGEVIEHRRPGGGCPRCGAEMVHGTVGGRSTWWCGAEQVR